MNELQKFVLNVLQGVQIYMLFFNKYILQMEKFKTNSTKIVNSK